MRTKGTPTDTNVFVLAKHFEGRDRAPTIDAAATAVRLHDRAIAMGLTWDGVGHIVVEWINDEPRVAMARAARKAKR